MARLGSLGGGDDGDMSLSADINVTSLVDVAFVLLIIFMIAAPMMTGRRGRAAAAGRGAAPHRRARGWWSRWTGRAGSSSTRRRVTYNDFRVDLPGARREPEAVAACTSGPTSASPTATSSACSRSSGTRASRTSGLVAEEEDQAR